MDHWNVHADFTSNKLVYWVPITLCNCVSTHKHSFDYSHYLRLRSGSCILSSFFINTQRLTKVCACSSGTVPVQMEHLGSQVLFSGKLPDAFLPFPSCFLAAIMEKSLQAESFFKKAVVGSSPPLTRDLLSERLLWCRPMINTRRLIMGRIVDLFIQPRNSQKRRGPRCGVRWNFAPRRQLGFYLHWSSSLSSPIDDPWPRRRGSDSSWRTSFLFSHPRDHHYASKQRLQVKSLIIIHKSSIQNWNY